MIRPKNFGVKFKTKIRTKRKRRRGKRGRRARKKEEV
jgi:hypothetical protein